MTEMSEIARRDATEFTEREAILIRQAVSALPYSASLHVPRTFSTSVDVLTFLDSFKTVLEGVAERNMKDADLNRKLMAQRDAVRDFFGTGNRVALQSAPNV